MVKRHGSFLLVLVMIIMAGLSGCASMDDQTRTKTEGAAAGATGGAVLGGIIGYIVGGEQGALIGAGTGAATGGVAGYAYGANIAAKKAQYANEEDWLDAAIAQARSTNQQLASYNARLQAEMAALQSEANQVLAAYKNKQATAEQVQAVKQKIDGKHQEAQQQAAMGNAAKQDLAKVQAEAKGAGTSTRQMASQQSAELKTNVAQTEDLSKSLASLSRQMNI